MPNIYNSYDKERLAAAVSASSTMVETMRRLGVRTIGGGSWQHVRNKIRSLGISTAHFRSGHARIPPANKKIPEECLRFDEQAFRRAKTPQLRQAMLQYGIAHLCKICGQAPEWLGKSLVLDIDHIDGDWRNNRPDNLRFLCPNCHSQTATWRKGRQANQVEAPR